MSRAAVHSSPTMMSCGRDGWQTRGVAGKGTRAHVAPTAPSPRHSVRPPPLRPPSIPLSVWNPRRQHGRGEATPTPALTRATHLELDLPHLLLGAEDGPADDRREDVRREVVAREAALDKLRWRRRSVRDGAARTQMRAAAGDPHPGAIVADDRRLAHVTD